MALTSIHDQISSDLRLPVVPGSLKTLCEADAEILEVAFAHQGLRGAGSDQCALDGQDQSRSSIKVYAVVSLEGGRRREGSWRLQVQMEKNGKRAHLHFFGKGS